MQVKRKIRILIVDDFEMTRSLLRIILRSDEFEIVGEAVNGQQGIEQFEKLQPDIVLLDVVMPVLSGLDTLERIHKINPKCLVLMVTGADDQELVDRAMQNGASGYILKPFNSASVLETLSQARDKFIKQNPATYI